MAEKDTIAAQVRKDSPLHTRFEEYEEEQKYESRSEAVRALLRAGLHAHEEDQQEHREEARAVTSGEKWCREKVQSWMGMGVLSAMGFAFLFLVFGANHFGFTVVPDWPISPSDVRLPLPLRHLHRWSSGCVDRSPHGLRAEVLEHRHGTSGDHVTSSPS